MESRDKPEQNEQQSAQQAAQEDAPAEEALEDAPMGSDHGDEDQNEEDIVYVDDDEMAQLEAMADEEEAMAMAEAAEDGDDFETVRESEFADGDEYEDGQVLQLTAERNDSVGMFNDHHDSVYCIDSVQTAENEWLFASGDGKDNAFIWKMTPRSSVAAEGGSSSEQAPVEEVKEESSATQASPMLVEKVQELPGHTETVEFCKFDFSGKWLVTGGMNNFLRVWDVSKNFALKRTIDSIPQEDLNFVEWHGAAPVLITGGKDYMIWLVNALNGKVMTNLIGHEEEVLRAQFTKEDKGKHIVSCSADKSIKVWSPLRGECTNTLKSFGKGSQREFHESQILCFALHPSQPVILSGDENGLVFASQYMTGEINGVIGQHADSCETIVISPTQPIACSAGIDSKIHVYDLTNFTRRLTVTIGEFGGFSKLLFSKNNANRLIAASTLGDVSVIDPRDGSVQSTFKGHFATINDIIELKTNDDSMMLATAGDDNHCLVFRQ